MRQRLSVEQAREPRAKRQRARSAGSTLGVEHRRGGEEGPLAVASDRELGQDQKRGRQRRPVRRGAAIVREREAARPDRACARRQAGGLVRRAGREGRRRSRARDVGEARGSARDRLGGGTEAREREAAIGLLPGKPAIGRKARSGDRADGIG